MAKSQWVVETTAETFEQDVIERSKQTPVVLDFWAPWCGPCRQLGPILEKAADQHAGQFVVVKANSDEMQQHAAAFGVQGIPAVYALKDGEVVDGFVGLLAERELEQWLGRFLPSVAELLTKEADQLAASDTAGAEQKYRAALASAANYVPAKIGLARVLLSQGKQDECRGVLADLESRGFLEPEAQQLLSQLHLSEHAVSGGQLDALRAQVRERPKELALTLQLAEALLAAGQYPEGFDLCLTVVERDAGKLREQGRTMMVDAFRVLGDASDLTLTYRRKLSSALY
ncbi:MAG: tetratricopeptide repeat protein [Pirellulaceae bacterium]